MSSSSFRPKRQEQSRPLPGQRRDRKNPRNDDDERNDNDKSNNQKRRPNNSDDDDDFYSPPSFPNDRTEERYSSSLKRGVLQNRPNNRRQRQPLLDRDINNNNNNDRRNPSFNYKNEDDEDDRMNDSMTTIESTVTIPSHFFSQKSLQDPAFIYTVVENNYNNNNSNSNVVTTPTTDELFHKLCQGAAITRPSRIQALAWPILLQQPQQAQQQQQKRDDDPTTISNNIIPQHTIVADQTGSGKTLAYLLPLLQRILVSKYKHDPKSKLHGSPRLLVLAPTAELADQIKSVCDRLQQTVSFSTMVMTATGLYVTNIRDQIRLLQRQPVDVLISTPGRMATILRTKSAGGLNLTNVESIVLDEVDILLQDDDATFGDQLRTIAQAAPVTQCQFVFVTATLPDRIVQTITQEFPNVVQVRGPGLHRVAPTLDEHLVDVSVPRSASAASSSSSSSRSTGAMGDEEQVGFQIKSDALLQALRRHASRKTLVFCNTVNSCRQVENLLQRHDRRGQKYQVGAYHNAMTPQARNQNLARFNMQQQQLQQQQGGSYARNNNNRAYNDYNAADDFDDDDNNGGGYNKREKRKGDDTTADDVVDQILVCTDRAARGVDFGGAPVDHVILFDFPKDPAEYVRRVGRTARAGRAGTCTILAYGWQLPIARQLMNNNKNRGGSGNKAKSNTFVKAMKDWEADSSNGNDNDYEEDLGGGRHPNQPRRNKQSGKQTWKNNNNDHNEQIIKGNIEGGRLWKERRVDDDPPNEGGNTKRIQR